MFGIGTNFLVSIKKAALNYVKNLISCFVQVTWYAVTSIYYP